MTGKGEERIGRPASLVVAGGFPGPGGGTRQVLFVWLSTWCLGEHHHYDSVSAGSFCRVLPLGFYLSGLGLLRRSGLGFGFGGLLLGLLGLFFFRSSVSAVLFLLSAPVEVRVCTFISPLPQF